MRMEIIAHSRPTIALTGNTGNPGGLLDVFNAGPPILGLKGGYPVIFTLFFVWLLAGSLAILKVREPRR